MCAWQYTPKKGPSDDLMHGSFSHLRPLTAELYRSRWRRRCALATALTWFTVSACTADSTHQSDVPDGSTIENDAAAQDPGDHANSNSDAATPTYMDDPAGSEGGSDAGPRGSLDAGADSGSDAGEGALTTQCSRGTFDDDADPTTGCTTWTSCAAGKYVKEAGSSTHDRTCAACPEGMFSDSTNATSCREWTLCEPGEFVTAVGTSKSDRHCGACASGMHSSVQNAAACHSWTVCPPGSRAINEPSESVDRACDPCAPGTHSITANSSSCDACSAGTDCSDVGTVTPLSCLEGTWDHDRDPASACQEWATCPPGKYVAASGTALVDRQCTACPNGRYSAEVNVTSCTRHVDCIPGQYVAFEGSSSTARQCGECSSGTYSTGTNAATCIDFDVCIAGEYISTPGNTVSARECEQCAEGYFSETSDAGSCQEYANCSAGTAVAGSTTHDRECASSVKQLAAGGSHTCALRDDGTVMCWGDNSFSKLGDETETNRTSPVAAIGVSSAIQVVVSSRNTCVLHVDGGVACWGDGSQGRLGNGATLQSSSPVNVLGLTDVTSIAAGSDHTCALRSDGTVACWGYNANGQLGDGTTTNSAAPVAVSGLSNVKAIAAGGGSTTCALSNDGTVACWGFENTKTPVTVSGLAGIGSIAVGTNHSCALRTTGSVACWGNCQFGQFGNGLLSTDYKATPFDVTNLSEVQAVTAGSGHSCALLASGDVTCWGSNSYGQTGTSSNATSVGGNPQPIQTQATQVGGLSNVASIEAGAEHTCARRQDGHVFCWGRNISGQLGIGSTSSMYSPVEVDWP